MKKQPHPIDTRFEQFVQELPADYQQQAYEFKAFARARKIPFALTTVTVGDALLWSGFLLAELRRRGGSLIGLT
ncbi:hypothetical protein [methane-oxidizing endosymbiont of Gigantopelta aegis]|uniref:hypothetical protein n=1 Tax=methane-oxidizing endosymbiont of Gigantopelta aegis TaxID=2794938 RepID=UPI001FDA8076|nr:hypothetical protein [methane-oxidizing endosymbiont of Gigantopelta aegis]